MASCNMCRNGFTALGRHCPNGCKPLGTKLVLEMLQRLSERVDAKDQIICRDAIGEIIRLQCSCGEIGSVPLLNPAHGKGDEEGKRSAPPDDLA